MALPRHWQLNCRGRPLYECGPLFRGLDGRSGQYPEPPPPLQQKAELAISWAIHHFTMVKSTQIARIDGMMQPEAVH